MKLICETRMLKTVRLILSLFAMFSAASAYADTPTPSVPLTAPHADTVTPHGVSVASGSFNFQNEDLRIGPGDLGLTFDRSYSSGQSGASTSFPLGWGSNFDIHIRNEKLQNSATFTANSLLKYGYWPLEWPYIYYVMIGSRSVPFLGGTGPQNDPCPNQELYANVLVCPTGGFVGAYSVARQGGEMLSYAGDEDTGHFTFTDTDGTVIYFGSRLDPDASDPNAAPLQAIYEIKPNGLRYDFYYDSGKLLEVKNNGGYAFILEYDPSSGSVKDICAKNLSRNYVTSTTGCTAGDPQVGYDYDSPATYSGGSLLTSFTDVQGNSESYSYGQYDHMTCLKKGAESACRVSNIFDICVRPTNLTFDADRMHLKDTVSSQTLSTGELYSYHIAHPSSGTFYCPIATPDGDPRVGGDVTNPDGSTNTYAFGPPHDGLPTSITDALGRVTSYTYKPSFTLAINMGDLVTSETLPSGLETSYSYDGRGNLNAVTKTAVSGETSTASYTYPATCDNPATCNKPSAFVDWNGNETDWTYASWGGLASELDPASTPGAARPLKLSTYVQKSAYVLNSSGALVSTGQPIWLIDTETVCQTVPGSRTLACDAGAPKTVTTYQYGADGTADNLLVRGVAVAADGQTQRTCYGYDAYGNRISETKPLGTGIACP